MFTIARREDQGLACGLGPILALALSTQFTPKMPLRYPPLRNIIPLHRIFLILWTPHKKEDRLPYPLIVQIVFCSLFEFSFFAPRPSSFR